MDETEILPAADDKNVLNLMPESAPNEINCFSEFHIVFKTCACTATKHRDLDTELNHNLIVT